MKNTLVKLIYNVCDLCRLLNDSLIFVVQQQQQQQKNLLLEKAFYSLEH